MENNDVIEQFVKKKIKIQMLKEEIKYLEGLLKQDYAWCEELFDFCRTKKFNHNKNEVVSLFAQRFNEYSFEHCKQLMSIEEYFNQVEPNPYYINFREDKHSDGEVSDTSDW